MHYRDILIPLFACCSLFFGACASDSTGVKTSAVVKHPESIVLKVTGGSDTPDSSASQVSRSYFAAEAMKSLRKTGLFEKVLSGEETGAEYRLDIAVADLPRPEMGASMTATVDAKWTLVRVSNGYELWHETISSSHTTKPGEAFTGVERLRLAIDGATRANIQNGIQQLEAVSIP
jgi:hypothetical protein